MIMMLINHRNHSSHDRLNKNYHSTLPTSVLRQLVFSLYFNLTAAELLLQIAFLNNPQSILIFNKIKQALLTVFLLQE